MQNRCARRRDSCCAPWPCLACIRACVGPAAERLKTVAARRCAQLRGRKQEETRARETGRLLENMETWGVLAMFFIFGTRRWCILSIGGAQSALPRVRPRPLPDMGASESVPQAPPYQPSFLEQHVRLAGALQSPDPVPSDGRHAATVETATDAGSTGGCRAFVLFVDIFSVFCQRRGVSKNL